MGEFSRIKSAVAKGFGSCKVDSLDSHNEFNMFIFENKLSIFSSDISFPLAKALVCLASSIASTPSSRGSRAAFP